MILKKLASIAEYAAKELAKPDGFHKGEAFEGYVRATIAMKTNLSVIKR